MAEPSGGTDLAVLWTEARNAPMTAGGLSARRSSLPTPDRPSSSSGRPAQAPALEERSLAPPSLLVDAGVSATDARSRGSGSRRQTEPTASLPTCQVPGRDEIASLDGGSDSSWSSACRFHGGYELIKEYRETRAQKDARFIRLCAGSNEIAEDSSAEAWVPDSGMDWPS